VSLATENDGTGELVLTRQNPVVAFPYADTKAGQAAVTKCRVRGRTFFLP
jgi:hypothetical protein